jgi:hypothetical protein
MALFFCMTGGNGRNTVADAENGEGNLPAMKYSTRFMIYMDIPLGLRNDWELFDKV